MKYIKYISIVLLLCSCQSQKNQEARQSLQHKNEIFTSSTIRFPFDQSTYQMRRDSLNEFGAGDCWGSIQSYSNQEYSIMIDTTNCGDYGFYLDFYLFRNGSFKIAHQIEGDYSTFDDKQIITENVYDYRMKPFKHLQRIDTGNYSINEYQMDKQYDNKFMEDYQTTYEHIMMNIEGSWKMTIDY